MFISCNECEYYKTEKCAAYILAKKIGHMIVLGPENGCTKGKQKDDDNT